MSGLIFAVVGPSGAGKDSVIAAARSLRPSLHLVRRVITRPASLGGEDYEGIAPAAFAARAKAGEFALSWAAHGLDYAIPKAELAPLAQGKDVIFNGSRAGLTAAAALLPQLQIIVITAPAALLAQRLQARGREAVADQRARGLRADIGLPEDLPAHVPRFELVNDSTIADAAPRFLALLDQAKAEALGSAFGAAAVKG